ncbi:hypothetical protein FA95DRAFT_1600301 [Auriscalpium vulgare]|uniref:Uncharacterized protein n=1 Tax=Auriscalpium vulgare TaxID=40419 RepID=A0ACB8R0M9_9AGAM|nr:hypothetical protein FA95DRAFT_1600301 [Auriscalpium vulgare]
MGDTKQNGYMEVQVEFQVQVSRPKLLAAEAEARARKRKANGLPAEEPSSSALPAAINAGDEESNKRRKLLQDALELDKDDDSDEEDEDGSKKGGKDGEKAKGGSDDDDDSDEEEDDTAELLRELEKIKRERAAEKARQEAETSAVSEAEREAQIATANPLMNLAAALGQAPGVKHHRPRRVCHLIFKNQAVVDKDKSKGQFVNDLLRTEFHKKFMARFVK